MAVGEEEPRHVLPGRQDELNAVPPPFRAVELVETLAQGPCGDAHDRIRLRVESLPAATEGLDGDRGLPDLLAAALEVPGADEGQQPDEVRRTGDLGPLEQPRELTFLVFTRGAAGKGRRHHQAFPPGGGAAAAEETATLHEKSRDPRGGCQGSILARAIGPSRLI